MSTTPEGFTGRIILVAEWEAKPDKVSELEKALLTIKARADSDAEPGCFTYRLNKFGHKFVLYEEYENQAAVQLHMSSDTFQALTKVFPDVAVGTPKILYYEECKL
ncbi:hypothetical protein EXIGLDRAFT_732017 [Exidia glandulosa HHB12029]|uniref:ABM domain-containing protein n=1 Tax=Exidia glandulosa HHB12029 TaxID=1314781 RepID=A0A165KV90_EXIGL|nr:hypothetical protein EXIGLDRAFT_732017 [Exidia glandulosa HHB12029]